MSIWTGGASYTAADSTMSALIEDHKWANEQIYRSLFGPRDKCECPVDSVE